MYNRISNRSSDSAKYTNKSSGTSVLSGNINTSAIHAKFYSGNRHRENDRQSHGSINIATAPVHKKFVANTPHCEGNNHIINRFINNNNTQTYNNHYSLSLNRHAETHNANLGVGCISTLTSPYAGNGVESVRATKSDIGIPVEQRRMHRNGVKSSLLPKSALSSVHSELSLYETTFKDSSYNMNDSNTDFLNNNHSLRTPIAFSKTGSKLLYTNKHRLNPSHAKLTCGSAQARSHDVNANTLGPLLYKNDGEAWKNSVYDNPIRSVSVQRLFSGNL